MPPRADAPFPPFSVHLSGLGGGLHIVWHLPHHLAPAIEVAVLARKSGLDAVSVGAMDLMVGFGVPDEHHVSAAVGRLADLLASADRTDRPASAD